MARLSFALPSLARCERPRAASVRAWRLQPGRLAQGPDEKCGVTGRTPGFGIVMTLPFQIGAPRWGGVSRGRGYATMARGSTRWARARPGPGARLPACGRRLELEADGAAEGVEVELMMPRLGDADHDRSGAGRGELHELVLAAQEDASRHHDVDAGARR